MSKLFKRKVENEEMKANGTAKNCHAELAELRTDEVRLARAEMTAAEGEGMTGSSESNYKTVSASEQFGIDADFQAGKTLKRVQGDNIWKVKRTGFTLAEVLITLVVIGVVAAITIPVLQQNTSGKEWNAAKQKARASLGEAFKLMSINGELENYDNGGEDVVDKVLQKYIKTAKICKGDNAPTDCGFSKTFKTPEGGTVNSSDLKNWSSWIGSTYTSGDGKASSFSPSGNAWKAGFFQTLDGFSIALFYNPNCRADEIDNAYTYKVGGTGANKDKDYMHDLGYSLYPDMTFSAACFNAVYDMNGNKGPNTVGKDIGFTGSFFTGVSARTAAVLPVPGGDYLNTSVNFGPASDYCKKLSSEYDLPTVDELSLLYLNNKAVGNPAQWFWSRSVRPGSSTDVWFVSFNDGRRGWLSRTSDTDRVRCVRADKLM